MTLYSTLAHLLGHAAHIEEQPDGYVVIAPYQDPDLDMTSWTVTPDGSVGPITGPPSRSTSALRLRTMDILWGWVARGSE